MYASRLVPLEGILLSTERYPTALLSATADRELRKSIQALSTTELVESYLPGDLRDVVCGHTASDNGTRTRLP